MGIYFKGMDMPNECRNCRMSVYHGNTGKTWCTPADAILAEGYKPIQYDGRPDWCPLTEVAEPHGRLIDADDFFERLGEKEVSFSFFFDGMFVDVSNLVELLGSLKTVIEAEGEEK